ncbi:hypothetical protein MVEN_02397200 [Mycena venus]|uniref:Uncharacterized protein n=1 Tax=Mycena venus TaxID=2733690 RepID=A0A8H6X2L6_9AGAR|nr:hypothetical protein MVEN_02397200 [Mycena venus]
MSTPLQKPLLLPGIAPHLFQSRRAHKTVKTSSSLVTYRRSATIPEPSSPDQTASSHNKQPSDVSMHSDYASRRTAEALVEAQAAEIALLHASVASPHFPCPYDYEPLPRDTAAAHKGHHPLEYHPHRLCRDRERRRFGGRPHSSSRFRSGIDGW